MLATPASRQQKKRKLTLPSRHRNLLSIPSPQKPLRLPICPPIRILRSTSRRSAELRIACLLLRSIGQMQRNSILGARLLYCFGAGFARFLIRLQGDWDLIPGCYCREEYS